jgi:hypothetical protein
MARGMTFPERPLLRPGVLVTRRDDGHLQVGLDPSLALVTPDVPAARDFLRSLSAGLVPSLGPAVARLARDLLDRGLVIDGAALQSSLSATSCGAQAVSAAYAQAGLDAATLLARRADRPVVVEAPALPTELRELTKQLLAVSGIPTGGAPYASLLVAVGEFDRGRVDALSRSDIPHLLAQVNEGIVALGPFVVPGVTACLRCVDAHRGDTDPRRALVVEQYARADDSRSDGVPAPIDPAVLTAALAWAVRDLVSFVDDEVPCTWSASVQFGPGMRQTHRRWERHEQCGCSWADFAVG